MKALSLWQPWASAVALGHKRIETRHWSTKYRGQLVIHAAKRWTSDEQLYAHHFARLFDDQMLATPPLGAIVAVADLVDVRSTLSPIPGLTMKEDLLGNYAPGRFGWMLDNVRPLPAPILARGAQGLFSLPADIAEQVRGQVK